MPVYKPTICLLLIAGSASFADGQPPDVRLAAELGGDLLEQARATPPARVIDGRPTPILVGRTVEVARQAARVAEMPMASGVYYIAPEKWRDDLLPDVVYLQSPVAKLPVRPGTPLVVWTYARAAAEQPRQEMPNMRGKTLAQALILLADRKLVPAWLPADARAAASERILRDQFPSPGVMVYERTTVHIVLEN